MTARALEKRLAALEGRSGASPIIVIVNKDRLEQQAAIARWEAENGPLGDSHLLLVDFVDATL